MRSSLNRLERSSGGNSHRVAFDRFELDLRSGELRKDGRRTRLQAQPFQLLALLIENAGEVLTRDEICRDLWPADTFVDFEHSLASAVKKIRDALGDSADNPRFIETLPKRGYRFIGKIRPELPVVMAPPETQESAGPAAVAAPKAGISPTRMLVPVLVAVLAVAALFIWLRPRTPRNPEPMSAVPFTAYPGVETAPAISPDGTRIAFSWDNDTTNKTPKPAFDLYVKAVGSETLLRLTNHPADSINSTWSPDGTQIAFHRLSSDDTGIYVVPSLGGPERKLLATHAPYDVAAPLSWSPDGKWLAFADAKQGVSGNRDYLLNVATLEVRDFPRDPACIHEGFLTFSHSGKELAFLCVHNVRSFEYFVSDLEGKSSRSLATRPEFPMGLIWKGDDQSLIVASETTKGVVFQEIRLDGSTRELPPPAGDWPTISSDGSKLAFASFNSRVNIWRKDLQHPEAPPEQMLASSRMQNNGQYSPDGKHVVFDSERSGVWSIWLADVDGGNLVQISHDRPAGSPRWSPDSRKIAFEMTEADGSESVYTADIFDRVPHKLQTGLRASSAPSWSRDGKWIFFRGYEGTGHQIFRCPAEGGQATLLAAAMEYDAPIVSLDGKTLYFAWSFGKNDLTMLPLDRPGAAPQTVPQIGQIFSSSQWAVVADGIYFTPLNNPRTISFFDFARRMTREVFRADKDLSDGMSISPDGRYMLYSQVDEVGAEIMLVNNFR